VILPDTRSLLDPDWIARFFNALAQAASIKTPDGASARTREMGRLAREQAQYHLGHVAHATGGLAHVAAAWQESARGALCISLREFVSHLAHGFAAHGRVPHCGAEGRALLSGPAQHDGPLPFLPTRPAYRYAGDQMAEVQLNFGLPIFVDTTDDSVAPDIIRTGWWEPWIDGVVRRSLGRGDVAVNVGANVGYHALLMASCVQDSGKVFAFEPNPRASQLLRRSLTWGGLMATTTLFPFAAGERCGPARFLVNRTFLGGGSFYEWSPDLAWLHLPVYSALGEQDLRALKAAFKLSAEPINVHMATLDETVGRNVEQIHLLLMDVQQAEPQVLEGASALIARSPDLTIIMEWGYGEKLAPNPEMRERARAAIEKLSAIGFEFWNISGDTLDVYARPGILTPMSVEEVMATDHFVDIFARRRGLEPLV
jgi:FkbM family methyltransferase